jgi:hypothetical protein
VGLVSIFVVSYAAVWSSPANADSQGPGTGGGNSVALDDDQILVSADPLPTNLTLTVGQKTTISLRLLDGDGNESFTFPALTINWSASGNVSIVGPTNLRTVEIQANSSGSGTVSVSVQQIQESQDYFVLRDMTVTVVNPGPTPTPSTPLTNPGTPPATIPNSQGVVTPEGTLLVTPSGVVSGNNPQSSALKSAPAIYINRNSVSNFYGASISVVSPTTLPAMPSRFVRGSSAASITFVNQSGVVQENFRLLRSAQICLPTVSSDRANGFSNVRLLRYSEEVGQWVELTSTYNALTQQVCAYSSNFSNFAVGVLQVQATQTPDGNLPATGGWSPSVGLLMLAGVLGFGLVGGGAVSMRRARNARPE